MARCHRAECSRQVFAKKRTMLFGIVLPVGSKSPGKRQQLLYGQIGVDRQIDGGALQLCGGACQGIHVLGADEEVVSFAGGEVF